jgi:hypothetical protein
MDMIRINDYARMHIIDQMRALLNVLIIRLLKWVIQ